MTHTFMHTCVINQFDSPLLYKYYTCNKIIYDLLFTSYTIFVSHSSNENFGLKCALFSFTKDEHSK